MPNYRPCTHPQLSVRRLAEKGETQCPGCGASVNISQWIDGPGKLAKNTDKKMSAFVVVMTDDPDAVESKLEKFAEEAKIKDTPLTIVEGVTGPPEYKLSKDAEVTVMMWVDGEVKVNQAFAKGKLDKKAVESLVGETKKILN